MKFFRIFKTTFLFFLIVFTLNLEANPTFARQYGMECSSCHSQVPALNDMGLSFLRNGLRTSTHDTTALKSFLDANSSKRHYPIGAMIGLSDNSNSDEVNRLVKLYLSGTITDSLSLMALTKESFKSNKSGQRLFESDNSQFYFQYNFSEAKQVFRLGLLSPWTQLGNVKRSMAHSGLQGGVGHGDTYLSPLDHAYVQKIKGAEYSYLFDNNILLLFSYGETVDDSSSSHSYSNDEEYLIDHEELISHGDTIENILTDNNNLTEHQKLLLYGEVVDKSNNAFLGAIKYTTASNYKIGLIYNYVEMQSNDYYSLILPIEKEYEYFIWNSSFVYADYSDDNYLGLENAFTFPLREMEHVKAIVNFDKDENDNTNFGYSLGYTKIYKMLFFEAVASRVNTNTYSSNKMRGSFNFIF